MNNFAIFILSHGRPDNVVTIDTLARCGYTGKYYIVIDNEDKRADEYFETFGERVIQFDKMAVAETFDEADNFGDRRTVVYARNVCFELAKDLDLTHFMELDDDYTEFSYHYPKGDVLKGKTIHNMDKMIQALINFVDETGAMTIAMAQGGDFIGGLEGGFYKKGLARKAMNSFICRTADPFKFIGRINEDVNTYTSLGSRGKLLFTVTNVMLNQIQTQSNAGGMSDVYELSGTYVKSFYTVMMMPSAVTVSAMGSNHSRVHHKVNWECCVPKILNERLKKGGKH